MAKHANNQLATLLRQTRFTGQPFAETLASAYRHLGHQVELKETDAGDPVLVVHKAQAQEIIRCQYYEDSLTPAYMAAFGEALLTGKAGRGWAITVDRVESDQHAYTIHVVIGRFDK
ncbi:MAG: hypothetical protein L0331_05825 [Chloroflexi bacterium]|nr:hypothetical protein [Chloroflexota bacterium]